MITFATLVGYVALAAALFASATYTGPAAAYREQVSPFASWALTVLTIALAAGGLIACGGAFATFAQAVAS